MTPTPGQPLSEADVSLGNLHTAIMDVLCEDIVRQRPDAFREGDEDGFEGDIIIPTGGTPRSAFAKINVSELAEVILPLVRPHAPVSRPGDGVEGEREQYLRDNLDVVWTAVEDMAKIGIQVARTNKNYATEDRDRARIDFIGEVCRRWAQSSLTPPAEPVSRPAGEGEREAVARIVELAIIRHGIEETALEGTLLDADAIIALLSPAAPDAGGGALASIAAERRRQVDVEGWTPEHDDEHDDYSLGLAAASYAGGVDCGSKVVSYTDDVSGGRGDAPVWGTRKKRVPTPWPASWDPRWWKPTGDRRRDLVKAGALIVAEIERLDRVALQPGGER